MVLMGTVDVELLASGDWIGKYRCGHHSCVAGGWRVGRKVHTQDEAWEDAVRLKDEHLAEIHAGQHQN